MTNNSSFVPIPKTGVFRPVIGTSIVSLQVVQCDGVWSQVFQLKCPVTHEVATVCVYANSLFDVMVGKIDVFANSGMYTKTAGSRRAPLRSSKYPDGAYMFAVGKSFMFTV